MKILNRAAVAVLATTMMGGAASAATLLTTLDDNDPFPRNLVIPEPYFVDTPGLAKCDDETDGAESVECSTWEEGNATGLYASAFTLNYYDTDDDGYSFDWTFDPLLVTQTSDVLYPKYVAVKQAGGFQVWLLDESEYFGGTIDTGLNDISHVSFYNTGLSEIPLPAAGWLLLAGLGGLAAYGRKKRWA